MSTVSTLASAPHVNQNVNVKLTLLDDWLVIYVLVGVLAICLVSLGLYFYCKRRTKYVLQGDIGNTKGKGAESEGDPISTTGGDIEISYKSMEKQQESEAEATLSAMTEPKKPKKIR